MCILAYHIIMHLFSISLLSSFPYFIRTPTTFLGPLSFAFSSFLLLSPTSFGVHTEKSISSSPFLPSEGSAVVYKYSHVAISDAQLRDRMSCSSV